MTSTNIGKDVSIMVHFSHRVDTSELNIIAQQELSLREQGIALQSLNDSNPTKHGLAPHHIPVAYQAQPRGQYAARVALASFLQSRTQAHTPISADDIYLLSSTSQAYSWLMKLLCDANDMVLAPKPGYPLIESIGRLECVQSLNYQLMYDGSWALDLVQLEHMLNSEEGKRVRAIIVINPNNPTGSYISHQEHERLVALCGQYDLAIIADEVFYHYPLEPLDETQSFINEQRVLTFTLDGFSKMLAAPHAKVGWIHVSGPQDVVNQAKRRLDSIADDYLPMSEIIAQRIPSLLDEADAQTARVHERTLTNLQTLHAMLESDEDGVLSVLRPEGGWNVLIRMPAVFNENDVIIDLINQYHFTGQPGYFFDMTSNGYLALSLLPEPQVFASHVRALQEIMRQRLASL